MGTEAGSGGGLPLPGRTSEECAHARDLQRRRRSETQTSPPGRGSGRDDHRATLTRRALPLVTALLTALTTIATFLPWGASGERTRSSYEIVDIADRAGVLDNELAGLAWMWFLVPVLCGGALLGLAIGRPTTVGVLSTTLGAMTVVGGILVTRSPLVTQLGARAAIVTGGLAACVGATTLIFDVHEAET